MTSAWRPSSGTEGEVFAANRCERCVNDRWDHATASGQSCPIWMNALAGVDDFHLYWDADAGHGECDMFYAKDEAQAAGVQAARDAVNVALLGTLQSTRDRALAAIDALRGES